MPVLTEAFSAGQTRRYNIPGGFFRLLSASENEICNVKAYSRLSGNTEYIDAVLPGLAFTLNFDFIEITSPSAQSISFAIFPGNVNYDRFELSTIETIGDVSPGTPIILDSSDGIKTNEYYTIKCEGDFYSSIYPTVPASDGHMYFYINLALTLDIYVDKSIYTVPRGGAIPVKKEFVIKTPASAPSLQLAVSGGQIACQNLFFSALRYK